jgi:uncharacterized protein
MDRDTGSRSPSVRTGRRGRDLAVGVELRPLGVNCNIRCEYCYQNPQRDARNLTRSYDLDLMKNAIQAHGGPFVLFGGEPLLVPESDLERLWSWGLERFGGNAVQTNGTLINDEHIRMFKEYKVSVGISVDGPGELNDTRWHGTLERTRIATAKTEAAIRRLCGEGLSPSLIITLHRMNAVDDKLPVLARWFRELDELGVHAVRLHLLESESTAIRDRFGLTVEENLAALRRLAILQRELKGLTFDLFADMRRMLLGRDNGTGCVWNACDPYTTQAVQGVEGDGRSSNCGRTNKDGIDFVKGNKAGFERYLALYATPQEAGGCHGCRFFLMCKGQCPGTAIDGDWRNRTEHCGVWMGLYEDLEAELVAESLNPLSLSPERHQIEHALLERWSRGDSAYMSQWTGWSALATE